MIASGNRPFRILLLDNTREPSSFGSPNLFRLALSTAPAGAEILVRRGPDLDFLTCPDPDALIVSGSITSCLPPYEEWVLEQDEFLKRHMERRTPILGVCFGHQALARCLFSKEGKSPALAKSKRAEVGWQTMRILGESPIFSGLGKEFVSYQSHYEEVTTLPPGTVHLAESDRCSLQAFQVKGAPVFGIQFHPEHTLEYGEAALKRKIEKGERGDWILNPGLGAKLYQEQTGRLIFGNFFKIAQQR
jgi:GMP synthase-like glutamine amidotransferase